MPAPQAAIFDFDGTIADSVDQVIDIYNDLARWYRVRSVSAQDIRQLRSMRPLAAMQWLGVPMWKLPFLVRSVRKNMRSRMHELSPFAGLDSALPGLRAAGIRCYVLSTNSRENIDAFLTHHRLQHFQQIAGGSSIFGKAAHIKKLVQRERLDPSRTFYVGDEVRDIDAAREAGLRVCSVTWGYSDRAALVAEKPDVLADSAVELLAALTA